MDVAANSAVTVDFSCDICAKKLGNALSKVRHEKTYSNKYKCSQCEKLFANFQRIKEHKEQIHTKEKEAKLTLYQLKKQTELIW